MTTGKGPPPLPPQYTGPGSPRDVLSDELISRVFECDLKVGVLPQAGTPFVLPQSAAL